jgi:hypothetical protein
MHDAARLPRRMRGATHAEVVSAHWTFRGAQIASRTSSTPTVLPAAIRIVLILMPDRAAARLIEIVAIDTVSAKELRGLV